MDDDFTIAQALSRAVLRKLRNATNADRDDDREIACQEVFSDITGLLDESAKKQLHTGGDACFYEVLASFYYKDSDAAVELLSVCRKLWGQPYVAPIFALLLHRFLLDSSDAGGAEHRHKHVNVLALGSRQLFLGDVFSGLRRFEPLFRFLCFHATLGDGAARLEELPPEALTVLGAAVAAHAPYYCGPKELRVVLRTFPSQPAAEFTSGGDFVLSEVTDALARITCEDGLVTYLEALASLRGEASLRSCSTLTSLRLQSELYILTSAGGPRYPPRRVQAAAAATLDALFPLGRRTRRLVRLLFTWLHPIDWAVLLWLRPLRAVLAAYANTALACLQAVRRLLARMRR